MLFCVSIGITHFWLVEAMRCLIKASPREREREKKEQTDYWGKIIKGSEWLCCVTLEMWGRKTNQDRERKDAVNTLC